MDNPDINYFKTKSGAFCETESLREREFNNSMKKKIVIKLMILLYFLLKKIQHNL